METNSSAGTNRDLQDAAGESQGGGQGDDISDSHLIRERMLADFARFIGSQAWEEDQGWTQAVYHNAWGDGFYAGLHYAKSLFYEIHDERRKKTSW